MKEDLWYFLIGAIVLICLFYLGETDFFNMFLSTAFGIFVVSFLIKLIENIEMSDAELSIYFFGSLLIIVIMIKTGHEFREILTNLLKGIFVVLVISRIISLAIEYGEEIVEYEK